MDDYSVFPFGYYRDGCEAAYSCNTFSAQGEYDLYDYQNPNDTFKTNQFKVKLDGLVDTDWAKHHLSFDLTQTDKSRHPYKGIYQYVNSTDYVGNITKIPTIGFEKKKEILVLILKLWTVNKLLLRL